MDLFIGESQPPDRDTVSLRFWGGAGGGRVVVKCEFLKELRKWVEHEITALTGIVIGVQGVNADKTRKQVMWRGFLRVYFDIPSL